MKGLESKTYYELLGVAPEATKEEIKAAYREIARVYHPDSHYFDDIVGTQSLSSTDNDVFKAVTNAYNILTDEKKRAEYDAILPKGLVDWDAETESSEPFSQFHSNMRLRKPVAFGTFGKSDSQPSAVDEALERGPRPVSEVLRARRTLFGRLMQLFGI